MTRQVTSLKTVAVRSLKLWLSLNYSGYDSISLSLKQKTLRREARMKYKIALHKSDEGYSVSVPGLPGCWSQGDTEVEAIANIETAICEYLEVVDNLLDDAEVREIELTV